MDGVDFKSKSLEDLVTIAEISGLMTREKASKMAKSELLKVMEFQARIADAKAELIKKQKAAESKKHAQRTAKAKTSDHTEAGQINAKTVSKAASETKPGTELPADTRKTAKSKAKATSSVSKNTDTTADMRADASAETSISEKTTDALPLDPKLYTKDGRLKKKPGRKPKKRLEETVAGDGTAATKTKSKNANTPAKVKSKDESATFAEGKEAAEDTKALTSAAVVTSTVETPAVAIPAVVTSTVETPAVATSTVETPAVATPAEVTSTVETPAVATPAVLTPNGATSAVATPDTTSNSPEFESISKVHVDEASTVHFRGKSTSLVKRQTRKIGAPAKSGEKGDADSEHAANKASREIKSPDDKILTSEAAAENIDDIKTSSLNGSDAAIDAHASEKTAEILVPEAEAGKENNRKAHKSRAENAEEPKGETVTGVLDIMPDGYGFLRLENYIQGSNDVYVSAQFIRRFGLRNGDLVKGSCRRQHDNDRYCGLYYIDNVNGITVDKMTKRPHFDRLTPIYPNERLVMETTRDELSARIIDLMSPIGKGQRGMIVSPPKAGKTVLLKKIANAITTNNPEVHLIVLLIDERPEEVTDMQRSIQGEVVYSTFDKTPENHVKITELVLERAMRLVELKEDVVILLDSITRMGRAYNLTINPTGRTLSGGLDPGALYGPKRFFGAARNIENGGSLTILATALVDTGSRMDEVIFEEFKGTGNMEVILDRKLSEKRIFPAIDIVKSGTRREDLLLSQRELEAVWAVRKAFGQIDTAAVTETMLNLLAKTRDNEQFVSSIKLSLGDKVQMKNL